MVFVYPSERVVNVTTTTNVSDLFPGGSLREFSIPRWLEKRSKKREKKKKKSF